MDDDDKVVSYAAVAQFQTYEDYLATIATWQDMYYLEDENLARAIVELGYRGTADFMKRDEFNQKRHEYEQSKEIREVKVCLLASEGLELEDPLLVALAKREAHNRDGSLATIIFLRCHNERNQEVSGYIDYTQRLKNDSFRDYFTGEAKLMPRVTDLAFYNWKTQLARCNPTSSWSVITESVNGLMFKSRRDRKVLSVDTRAETPGDSSIRTTIISPNYSQVVLYDHTIRQKI